MVMNEKGSLNISYGEYVGSNPTVGTRFESYWKIWFLHACSSQWSMGSSYNKIVR